MIEGVYNKDTVKEPKYYFKLENWSSEEAMIKIVDGDGFEIGSPYICRINKKTGKIHREVCVNNTIGFDLDKNGKVKVEVE